MRLRYGPGCRPVSPRARNTTFETPPRHVYQPDDVHTLTHFTSSSLDW